MPAWSDIPSQIQDLSAPLHAFTAEVSLVLAGVVVAGLGAGVLAATDREEMATNSVEPRRPWQ